MRMTGSVTFALASALASILLAADPAAPSPAPAASAPAAGQQAPQAEAKPVDAKPVDTEGWRYRFHDGRWWYWLPTQQWVYWDGSKWNDVVAPPAPTAAPAVTYANPGPSPYNPNYPNVWPYNDPNYYPYSTPGRWNGPWRPQAGWVGGFFSSGGGMRSQ
jgi:hypothetical protein